MGPLRKKIHGERKSEMQSTSGQEKSKEVKTVMFVPYTQGSELAKRLRDAEKTLQELTGYKIKMVERTGLKLEEMLHRADPKIPEINQIIRLQSNSIEFIQI